MSLLNISSILQKQLNRLEALADLTSEEAEAEMKRCNLVNATAGNLIKLSAVAVAGENLKLRYLEMQGTVPERIAQGLLSDG